VTAGTLAVHAQSGPAKPDPAGSSYLSVNEEDVRTVLARMRSAKPQVMERQMICSGRAMTLATRRPPA
jgi:hypothetical protein